jgi:hypothetical protein
MLPVAVVVKVEMAAGRYIIANLGLQVSEHHLTAAKAKAKA